MKKILVFTVLLLLAGVAIGPFLSFNAKANPDADGLWATTAEFDAGTKSQPIPADGNYQVETITDNVGISSNVFELSSVKGDTYAFADSDATTWRWTFSQGADGTGNCVKSFSNGVLNLTWTPAGTLRRSCADYINYALSGDYNVTVSWRITDAGSAGNPVPELCLIGTTSLHATTLPLCGSHASNYGVVYDFSNAAGQGFAAFKTVAGTRTQIGSNTDVSACRVVGTWCAFRITRSGTVYTWWRSSNAGATWTQDETSDLSADNLPSTVYTLTVMTVNGGSGNTASVEFDNYYLTTGTIVSGGFRATGNWQSDNYLVPTSLKRVGFVLLNFTGISSTYAIDKVELYRNDILREVFANDIITGTSANLTVSEVIESGANVSVRIYLKGNGAGTAVITRIQVFMVTLVNLVVTVSAYQIGAHSVILAGNVTYDAEPDGWLQIIFDFGTTPQAHERVNVGWVDTAGNFTILLYELEPGTIYYFHARVDGNVSGYADGNLMQFETLGTGLGMDYVIIILLFVAFVVLLIFGLIERFAMLGASIVAFFIAIESWVITTNVVLPAMFVFIGVICIAVTITRRV